MTEIWPELCYQRAGGVGACRERRRVTRPTKTMGCAAPEANRGHRRSRKNVTEVTQGAELNHMTQRAFEFAGRPLLHSVE